jgi:hypothetical protein
MGVKAPRALSVACALAALVGCGGNPLKVGHSGTGGGDGSGGVTGAAGTGANAGSATGTGGTGDTGGGAACGADQVANYCLCGGATTFVGCSAPGGLPACPGGCDFLSGPCGSVVDATNCKARPDCRPDECHVCGRLTFSCDPANEPAPSCPVHTCIKPSCMGLDEAMCDATTGCTPVQCPDCKGGQTFGGCAAPGQQIACGPCPPTCSALDETACKANSYCHPGYCSTCSGAQKFNVCLGPMEVAPCPGLMCPTVGPCSSVTDQLSCAARIDCHPVFNKCPTCDCPATGCAVDYFVCASGGKASCQAPTSVCGAEPPPCEAHGYVLSWVGTCFEGCVLPSECGP